MKAIKLFLISARNEARKNVPRGTNWPITQPFCEVEARFGVLKTAAAERRVLSSGPKRVTTAGGKSGIAHAFLCNSGNSFFQGGVTKSHYHHWTSAGLSEPSPLSNSFAVQKNVKQELCERTLCETVYGGYHDDFRVCFPPGKRECKQKLSNLNLAVPSAPYDVRLTLATERTTETNLKEPPRGYKTKRIKRRRSYTRPKNFAWQLDVTEVSSSSYHPQTGELLSEDTSYEIEMELSANKTLELVNATDEKQVQNLCISLGKQLWWMLSKLNCLSDVLDVEEFLQPHPSLRDIKLAQAQCSALFQYSKSNQWKSAIAPNGPSPDPLTHNKLKFPGCMPINFSRHNIEQVQRSNYFISEKTDGVRYLLIFTGNDTCVLMDRKLNGKQPKHANSGSEPMNMIVPHVKQGAVLDGEVVMHRKLRRPIYIVFDILALSATEPITHLPFDQRLKFLEKRQFQLPNSNINILDPKFVTSPNRALPLIKKNFVRRMKLDTELLAHVKEEGGLRCYQNGNVHHHLTDGIIFQPNLPYCCGTDVNLLKWKYLDTVTIDVELLPDDSLHHNNNNDDDDVLRVGVMGEDGTRVDMTRHIQLPVQERLRLEADRCSDGSTIAELGFDPTTGEWYYHTMRPDKTAPNHISTVLGTLLELAESLCTQELQFRLCVPPGVTDTWSKQTRKMQQQLLQHQRSTNQDYFKKQQHHH